MVNKIINASIFPLALFVIFCVINGTAYQTIYIWPYLLLVDAGYFGLSADQPNLGLLNLVVALSLILQIVVILVADLFSAHLRRK